MVVGQLVQVHRTDAEIGNWWEYGIVKHVFDDRVEIRTVNNSILMFYTATNVSENIKKFMNTDFYVSVLLDKGFPVILKKNIFGRYNFKKLSR